MFMAIIPLIVSPRDISVSTHTAEDGPETL